MRQAHRSPQRENTESWCTYKEPSWETGEQVGGGLALDDPVTNLRQAVRIRNTLEGGGQPLSRSGVELPRGQAAQ